MFANRSFAVAALLIPMVSGTAIAQSNCGDAESLRPNETIKQLAQRCNVPLDALMAANPEASEADGVTDRVLLMPEPATIGWADRARSAVRDAGRQVEEAATEAGRSVSEYLSDEPDLNRDILEFGERLGIPGITASPDRGAELVAGTLAGMPGDRVELSAIGLPGNAEVVIGAWIQGEFVPLGRDVTSSAGRLSSVVEVPEVPETEDQIRFMLRTADERLSVTSEPFSIRTRT